ncbi:uncharacterized protein LOC135214955 isoform X2 [Macrobrachium nipponense]|uniref:uncharacterized protein LOC135214955 isoform X2 n=1 Tax=Macrobrachium nipponense TaxID=159736 RepID=UPI0030C8C53E
MASHMSKMTLHWSEIKKLPASLIEYYLGKPPNEARDVFKPKLSKVKRKLLPVIGSDATRHNIKPLSAKKRKQNEKMKQNKEILLEIERLPVSVIEYYLGKSSEGEDVVCGPELSRAEGHEIEDNTEDKNGLYVFEVKRRNPRRKAASDCFIKMTQACNTEQLSTKSRSKRDNWVTHEVRKNPRRKAALETCEKITKAYQDMDDTEDFDDTSSEDVKKSSKRKEVNDDASYYSDSDSSLSSDDVKKPPKVKESKFGEIPEPEFSEYEKAAQAKLASHKDFLKSLSIQSWDEI